MRYLSTEQYDSVLRSALAAQGLSLADAERLIASRFPMESDALNTEAFGRGLRLNGDAWTTYLAEAFPDMPASDDFVALLNSQAVDTFFSWCVRHGHASLTPVGEQLQRSDADRVVRDTCRRAAAINN